MCPLFVFDTPERQHSSPPSRTAKSTAVCLPSECFSLFPQNQSPNLPFLKTKKILFNVIEFKFASTKIDPQLLTYVTNTRPLHNGPFCRDIQFFPSRRASNAASQFHFLYTELHSVTLKSYHHRKSPYERRHLHNPNSIACKRHCPQEGSIRHHK